MSVPPETIQVKRIKRTRDEAEFEDEAKFDVPDYLRLYSHCYPHCYRFIFLTTLTLNSGLHNPKRVQSDVFIYQRITQYSPTHATSDSSNVVPIIHPSKPGEENAHPTKQATLPQSQAKTSQTIETRPVPKPQSSTEPRRFHFSRPSLTPTSLLKPGSKNGKRSRNTTTTVFVEHKHKRSRTEDVQMKDVDAVLLGAVEEPPRKLKRPGADRKGPPKPATQVKEDITKSLDDKHWAAETDETSRRMNDFALLLIGQNLAEEEEREEKAAAAAARKQAGSTPHKLQPKPPAQRFAQRHPEVIAQQEASMSSAPDKDGEYETADEDDYIVETYVRVPASVLSKDVAPENIGLLVFGNDDDVEFFYGVEGDSDDEWAEDDEDENGELMKMVSV